VFPTINSAFQLLRSWIKYPRQQAALIRKIVDRIRNSLELQVVLQTAVDEVAALLELDCCSFLCYFKDTQRVQVVCERNYDTGKTSHLGYHPLESLGVVAPALGVGELIINSGTVTPKSDLFGLIAQKLPWLLPAEPQGENKILGYGASLLIPVKGKEGWIGFITCLSEKPRAWSAAEIEFLKSIAEPLEIAIRQAQLYEQTQKQAIRERLVNHIISQTRKSFDTETILTEATRELLEALQVDRCLVHLVENLNNTETGELNPECAIGFAGVQSAIATRSGNPFRRKHLYEGCRQPFAASTDDFDTHGPITQWVIQHRQLVMIPDITEDERIGQANEEYQKAQIKSSLVVPVQSNGILHALLYLNQCSHIRYWSKNDKELAQSVADQLAISLQQAYLYTRTQQQAAHSAKQAQKMSAMIEELRLTQINQAFLSILTNAIEALNRSPDPDKTITLCTKWLPSNEIADKSRVQIAIGDNGPGIKLEIQPRIFEHFFTTKDVGQGRGLGLTVSYQTIVNQHNGQLEVRSQPGRGVEFIIEIPIRHSNPLTSDPPPYTTMTTGSQTQSPIPEPQSIAATSNS